MNRSATLRFISVLLASHLPGPFAQCQDLVWDQIHSIPDSPFSFTYNGQSSKDLLSDWKREGSSETLPGGKNRKFTSYDDSSSGMVLQYESTEYADFGAHEWILRFTNGGDADTKVVSDVWALDCTIPCEATEDLTLYYADGSEGRVDDFHPRQNSLEVGAEFDLAPNGGRSSDGVMPYFNLSFSGRSGLIIAIGWTGQWKALIGRDQNSQLTLRTGMKHTHLKLHPGESIRTPSILLLPYSGDRQTGQNTLRRFLLKEILPKPGGRPLQLPIAASGATIGFSSVTESNQVAAIRNLADKKLPVDTWWMDAGWSLGGFPMGMGNPDPDPKRFAHGLRPVADEAHSTGLKFLLWFEPERVMPGTWLRENHPEWLLAPSNLPPPLEYQKDWRLLDLGNPEALDWVKTKVSHDISDYGVDIYRHDFNMHPLYYWRTEEEGDREGIHEIKYIQGLYEYFDFLSNEHPGLLLDNCASGGRRLDFEMMKRSVPLWRSDFCWDPIGGQSITFALSNWLPVHGLGAVSADAYSLRSGYGTNVSFAFDYYNKDAAFWEPLTSGIEEYRMVREFFFGDYYPLTDYSTGEAAWMACEVHR
ncbi:MAG: alpha-galactosidase, partial [Candidatus Omnitrophica bacterium]|nr:alpha-galactosidase [Candidatus Omnitrophota bacterium]